MYKTRSAAAATVGWFRFDPTGEIMHTHAAVATAAKTTSTVIGNISVDQLEARTPCSEFTVRQLINHLLFWGPSLAGAAHKETVPPAGTSEEDVDLTGDRKTDLTADIEGGVGQANIRLPKNVGVIVHASGGIGSIDSHGLKHEDDTYTNDAYGKTPATIRLKVEGGIGEIVLSQEL